jgi:hypothetical protein
MTLEQTLLTARGHIPLAGGMRLNKAMLISMFLVAVEAWAEPAETVRSLPPEPSPPRAAFWFQPVIHGSLMVSGVMLAPIYAPLHVALPLGATFPLSERTGLVVELTPMYSRVNCHDDGATCGSVRAVRATTGVAWTPWPGARGGGFFLQPKLGGVWSHEKDRPAGEEGLFRRSTTGGQLTLGLDLGYLKTLPRSNSYLALVTGAGVGYSWHQRRKAFDVGAQYAIPQGEERRNGFIAEINTDLLRIGFYY